MPDEPEFPFDGLDAERPLPPELRARLEATLLAAVAGGLPVPADAWGLHQPSGAQADSVDAPRPLPEPLRARLESALLAEAATSPAGTAPASASPAAAAASPSTSPAPGDVVPLAGRRRKVLAAWSSVAAVLLLVVMVAGLAGRGGNSGSGEFEAARGPTTTTLGTPASLPSDAGASTEAESPATTAPAAIPTTRATRPSKPSPSTTAPQAPGGSTETPGPAGPAVPTSPEPSGGAPAPASTGPGPAPPFYDSPAPGDSSGGAPAMTSGPPSAASPSEGGSQDAAPPNQTQKSTSPAPAGPALRVGIIAGDAAQEAGFRAYINRLNQAGGVQGHSIELVRVSSGAPAANTIATVNLSSLPVAGPGGAPSWATGPLLETLTATEDLLAGNGAVFSFASAPERQGHLAADALFPTEAAAGTRAVIYAPAAPGPLRDAVPTAIKAVLQQRNVANVQVVTYDPSAGKALTPADAAFVSLDPATAKAWVTQAKAEGYRPAVGVAGIYSLAEDVLGADLPAGARVVSPYVVPAGDEGQAIRSAGAGTSASVLHGWATAKSLAAAIWRTGADTPAEVQAALEGLTGWSSGLAPPYETRSGTRSRTPEGVVFQVQSGAFVAQGGFRRDPYPSPIQ